MLSIVTLALCVLQLQITHTNAAVQTPFGTVNQTLQVAYNRTLIDPPGLTIPLSIPVTVPTIGLTSTPRNDNYLVILVDPDSSKPNVLHWFQTNFTLSASNISVASLSFHPLLNNTPPLASYIKPNPPAGSGPHRYTELLYLQPANFSVPAKYASFFGPDATRTDFNLSSFVKDAGLGQPVAANYFLAENSTVVPTTGTGGSGSSATRTGGSVQATGTANGTATGTARGTTTGTATGTARGTATGSGTGSGTGTARGTATGTATGAVRFTGSANSVTGFRLSRATTLLLALSIFAL